MKNILFLMLCFSLFACSKNESQVSSLDNELYNSIAGKWEYSRLSAHKDFKEFTDGQSRGFIEFDNDNCTSWIHINDTEIIGKAKYNIKDNTLYIIEGNIAAWISDIWLGAGYQIEIMENTNNTLVLKWKNKEHLIQYTELERVITSPNTDK